MKQLLIVLFLLAAAVLLGTCWLTPGPATAPEAGPSGQGVPQGQPAAPAPAVAEAPAAVAYTEQGGRRMRMPDGSELAPLNGLTEAPNPSWDPKIPYVPPLRVETDSQGKQWYVFPDGSQIGTYNVYRSDLQKWEPITEVRHPKPVVPVLQENVDPGQPAKKQ